LNLFIFFATQQHIPLTNYLACKHTIIKSKVNKPEAYQEKW